MIFNRYPAIFHLLGPKSGRIIADAKRHIDREENY
jgi:hypothetical protein